MQALKGKAIFEHVGPDDLVDAARSLTGRGAEKISVSPPGIGVDELLEWSLRDVELAKEAQGVSDRNRCASNALLNGRRALACLVKWYLERDAFSLCKDAPKGAEEKASLLLNRGILDGLAASALRRAIEERDNVEHQFATPTLDQAEDFVQLVRSTIQDLRVNSDPSQGPFLFGSISYRIQVGAAGRSAEFLGWQKPCFLLCPFAAKPWLGVIVPEKIDPSVAVVRRAFFDEMPTASLLKVLQTLEQTFGPSKHSLPRNLARLVLVEGGLVNLA